MDTKHIKRWGTLESLSVAENYFDDITQIQRWSSLGNINQLTASSGKKNKTLIDTSLMCTVCNQKFNRPKLLHCLHSFCQSCIESIVKVSDGNGGLEVVCPICDSKDEICPAKVESLPTNFVLTVAVMAEAKVEKEEEKLIVICANCEDASRATGVCVQCAEFLCDKCTSAHRRVRVTREHCITPLASQDTVETTEKEKHTYQDPTKCSMHREEELSFYCRTCNTLVCRECTVNEHEKSTHEFEPLQDASSIFRLEMAQLLDKARVRLPFMRRTLLEIEQTAHEIPKHADAIAEQIRSSTARYTRALHERESQLLDNLDALREYKTTLLSRQKDRLLNSVQNIESACAFTQEVMNETDFLHVSAVSGFVVERMRNLSEAELDIQPIEGPELDYVAQEDELFDVLNRGGTVESGTSTCVARVLGEGLFDATVGKASTFTMATREELTLDGVDIRIETPDGVILSCNVTQHSMGILTVSYTPKIHGEHEITIQARGVHVEDSPYTVHVKKGHMSFATKNTPVCLRMSNKGNGRGEVECPTDVAVRSNGSIVVTDTGNHRVQLYDGRGRILHQFGTPGQDPGKFQSPAGVCIDQDGNIVVTDQLSNRVQVFTVDGVLVHHMGPKCGRAGGELQGPLGVVVDEEGQVIVVDQLNHRVVIFSPKGSIVHQFGSLGTKDGEFNNPSFIAVNQDGEIYVTDTCNHRIQIFDMNGNFVGKFGRPGTGSGEFQYPSGIAIDSSGYVFVSDRTNRVQAFNQHFRYVCKFGGKQSGDGQLCWPAGLDYTPEGRLAVADTANNCVKVFYFPKDQF